MLLEIITPDQKVFTGEVKLIHVPGLDGSFEIMHKHAPIIAIIGHGKVKVITEEGENKYFEVDGGVVEVKDNKVILLAERLVK
jgi:F-type H+-transporting ATPase subunit epsilon